MYFHLHMIFLKKKGNIYIYIYGSNGFKQQTWGVKRIYAIQIAFEQHGDTLTYRSGVNMLLVSFSQHLDKTTELRFEIYV